MIGAAYRASGPVMDQPVHGRIDSMYGLIPISLIVKWSEAGKRRSALLEETETGANIRPGTTERCYFYRLGYKLRPHRMLAAQGHRLLIELGQGHSRVRPVAVRRYLLECPLANRQEIVFQPLFVLQQPFPLGSFHPLGGKAGLGHQRWRSKNNAQLLQHHLLDVPRRHALERAAADRSFGILRAVIVGVAPRALLGVGQAHRAVTVAAADYPLER